MTFRPYEIVEADLVEYYALAETLKRSGVTIAAGTEYEMTLSADLLPTLGEWRGDPELTSWVARVPRRVAAAWMRLRDERCRQVEETMAMYDDLEGSATQNISGGQTEHRRKSW